MVQYFYDVICNLCGTRIKNIPVQAQTTGEWICLNCIKIRNKGDNNDTK